MTQSGVNHVVELARPGCGPKYSFLRSKHCQLKSPTRAHDKLGVQAAAADAFCLARRAAAPRPAALPCSLKYIDPITFGALSLAASVCRYDIKPIHVDMAASHLAAG